MKAFEGTRARATRDAGRTQEVLFSAGTDLFAEHGYKGTTVDRIARRAGVNKAMISYHFGGKLGLYRAILEDMLSRVGEELAVLRDSSRPADERLRAFVAIFAEAATRRPQFPAMMVRELIEGGAHMDEHVLALALSIAGLVREIVEQGTRDGTFRPVDPLFTHLSLAGSLIFFFVTAPFRDRMIAEGKLPAMPAGGYVRHVQDLMTRGLAAVPGPLEKGR